MIEVKIALDKVQWVRKILFKAIAIGREIRTQSELNSVETKSVRIFKHYPKETFSCFQDKR